VNYTSSIRSLDPRWRE